MRTTAGCASSSRPGADPKGPWIRRGLALRWASVRGLRLQTDAQIDPDTEGSKEIWRLTAEDPKIDLAANSDAGPTELAGLLEFARACLQHAG